MSNKEEILLQITLLLIQDNDLKHCKQLFEKIYKILSRKSIKDQIEVINILLQHASVYGRYQIARQIIYEFDNLPDNEQNLNQDSIYHYLFEDRRVDDEILIFLKDAFSEIGYGNPNEMIDYMGVMDAFMTMDDKPSLSYACKRATDVYGEQTYTTYVNLKEIAEDYENYEVADFMDRRIRKTSPYANKPSYVYNFMEEIPTDSEIKDMFYIFDDYSKVVKDYDNYDPEIIARKLVGKVEGDKTGEEKKKARKNIIRILSSSNIEEKRKIRNNFLSILMQDRNMDNENSEMFRLMGPSNPLIQPYRLEYDTDNLCQKYGCRMFYCMCFDKLDEDEMPYNDEKNDWFLKPDEEDPTCDYCGRKLKSRAETVRRPRPKGGWLGRYCNDYKKPFRCALKHLAIIENAGYNPQGKDILQRKMIKLYINYFEKHGIQERIEDNYKIKEEYDCDSEKFIFNKSDCNPNKKSCNC